ncbi:hypothetical protein P7D22_23130, partial [Lichenihabitans sp. Uapishka_5]|uniref:hypothetical protein n=1 Tax=Lichenihabitans sp. Uapishka_5 TaxID=3037302 RepID=UPI0029E7F6CF
TRTSPASCESSVRVSALGEWRLIHAQSATVASIVDGNGNPVSVAYSGVLGPDSKTAVATYKVGSVMTTDDAFDKSSGAFADPLNTSGIHFFRTMNEAIDSGFEPKGIVPNLTALGL